MAAKYYKKLSPDTKPVLSNGATVQFRTNDSVVGYFQTDNDYIHAEFQRFASLQQYGIEEITAEEYQADYLAKKNDSVRLNRPWREEMGPGSALPQIAQIKESLSAAVAVKGSDIPKTVIGITVATPAKDQLTTAPVKAEEFKPLTKKRSKKVS